MIDWQRGGWTGSLNRLVRREVRNINNGGADRRRSCPQPQLLRRALSCASFSSFNAYCCGSWLAANWHGTVGTEIYDVFVSYSRADWRHAADIDAVLRKKGLRSFFDRRNLAPGLPWVRALEQAIGAAKAAIVLIGPHGFGNTQQYERDLAFVRQSRDPAFPVVPVILP